MARTGVNLLGVQAFGGLYNSHCLKEFNRGEPMRMCLVDQKKYEGQFSVHLLSHKSDMWQVPFLHAKVHESSMLMAALRFFLIQTNSF